MRKTKTATLLIVAALLAIGVICALGCSSSGSQSGSSSSGNAATSAESPTPGGEGNADLALITKDGHPAFRGSVEVAHSVWGSEPKGKVLFPDSYDKLADNTVLVVNANRNSDEINGFEIYFDRFEVAPELSLDDVLSIAASYAQAGSQSGYELESSKCIVPNDDADKSTYYVVSYKGSPDVVIEASKDGAVQNLIIGTGTPKWMGFLDKNGYHAEEWACDLADYQ